jgi:shikimate kinase
MKESVNRETIGKQTKQLVAELVGPAGAGKTTIAQALAQRSNQIRLCTPPYYRRIEDFPFFLKNTLSFLPTCLDLYLNTPNRHPTLQEIAWMVTLNGWHQRFDQEALTERTIAILDQGPIFMLADLSGFTSIDSMNQNVKKWWGQVYERWADTLEMVIWLDASDRVLIDRIRRREKWHSLKDGTDTDLINFLGEYRESFNKVISSLAANRNKLNVIRFDTEQESLDEVIDKLLVEFGSAGEKKDRFVLEGSTQPVYNNLQP